MTGDFLNYLVFGNIYLNVTVADIFLSSKKIFFLKNYSFCKFLICCIGPNSQQISWLASSLVRGSSKSSGAWFDPGHGHFTCSVLYIHTYCFHAHIYKVYKYVLRVSVIFHTYNSDFCLDTPGPCIGFCELILF